MLGPNQQKSTKPTPADDATVTLTVKDRFTAWQQKALSRYWRFAISAGCTAVAASAVAMNLGIVQLWERQVQTFFFELRGPVEAPNNVVILTIDEASLSQGEYYKDDPERFADLAPIEAWPWRREAYARVISKLMDAGAKSVALDVLFSRESSYGPEDDDALVQVLKQYGDRIVLAANYSKVIEDYGVTESFDLPHEVFRGHGTHLGAINFYIEPNEQIHRLGQQFLADLPDAIQNSEETPADASAVIPDEAFDEPLLSFAQATLAAARIPYPEEPRENIFFFGPTGTFEQVPFWTVLDDDPWRTKLRSGEFFKDKMVIIGTTAPIQRDFHEAPFSHLYGPQRQMAGVEILATTIATLEHDLSPDPLIKNPALNGFVVVVLGIGAAGLIDRSQRSSRRALLAGGALIAWAGISYAAFVFGQTVLITGTPLVAIASIGLLDFGITFTSERFKRKRLRTTLARYVTSPLVQEIISQQDDFQDLLDENRADLIGKLLRDRYHILEVIGAGGFGETYLAQDTLRPGNPVCVVKQLKIVSDNPKSHTLARRLFKDEAVVLGELGEHSQIPRLLAYFESHQTFYLVQEMIVGQLLRKILAHSRPLSQRAVVEMLCDLLPVIGFVHSKGVIHRDIKPSNIIRRAKDNRYVLIDFGAVKTISKKLPGAETRAPETVGIGTQGYMPSEQANGMPTVRSDLYALGITAIEALTGRPPHALKRSDDGEIIWSHTIDDISPGLSRVINKMVRYDFNKRYPSSQAVLDELTQIDVQQLPDSPAIANNDFQLMPGTTLNQGTRPGVIDTDSELDGTQILPEDWLNNIETRAEKLTSEESASENPEAP
ncbi:MAG: serine/threonine-protein kinase [Cyanobacteria bacterium J06560_6]